MAFAHYELKKHGTIAKDGHTMHCEDIVKDLNRKTYLEELTVKLSAKLKPALAVRDAYMTLDYDKIMKAISDMRHEWIRIFNAS